MSPHGTDFVEFSTPGPPRWRGRRSPIRPESRPLGTARISALNFPARMRVLSLERLAAVCHDLAQRRRAIARKISESSEGARPLPGKTPTPEATVLLQLRRQSGWTQARLERTARLSRGTLSLYETGRRSLVRSLLNRLAVTLGHAIEDVDRALAVLEKAHTPDAPVALTPASLLPHEHRAVEAAAERAAARVRLGVGTRLIEARLRSERLEAANLWAQLRNFPTFRACRDRIDSDSRFRSWALCERLCDESVHVAARDLGTSLGLAKLALTVAEKTPGGDAWQCRVQGYAWAFVANSARAKRDDHLAEEAFLRSGEYWEAGGAAAATPLAETRLLSMKASLRREQGRFDEALSLLAGAIQSAEFPATRAFALIQLGLLFESQGTFALSLETLERAEVSVLATNKPRPRLVLESCRTRNLYYLGKFSDASKLLKCVQQSTLELGNELDALRVRWLSALINAGLGRQSQAIAQLAGVRQAFLRRSLVQDAGFVALDLAEVRGESR